MSLRIPEAVVSPPETIVNSADIAPLPAAAFSPPESRVDFDRFTTAYEDHLPLVINVASRFLGNSQDAEDVAQTVFERALRHWDSFEDRNLRGWLCKITTNVCIDKVRRNNRIHMEPTDFNDPTQQSTIHQDRPAFGDRSYVPTDETENSIILRGVLEKIPDPFGPVVHLVDVEDQSYQQASDKLGIKLGTVRSRLHRGRLLLREYLKDEGITSYTEFLSADVRL